MWQGATAWRLRRTRGWLYTLVLPIHRRAHQGNGKSAIGGGPSVITGPPTARRGLQIAALWRDDLLRLTEARKLGEEPCLGSTWSTWLDLGDLGDMLPRGPTA